MPFTTMILDMHPPKLTRGFAMSRDRQRPRATFALGLAFLILLWPARAVADVKLPAVLSSHMVLQRDMPVPIWGTAKAGEMVVVKFRDQEKTARADDKGKWLVRL